MEKKIAHKTVLDACLLFGINFQKLFDAVVIVDGNSNNNRYCFIKL